MPLRSPETVWTDVTSRKARVTFYRRPSGTVGFRRVSRCKDNGETYGAFTCWGVRGVSWEGKKEK